MEITKYSSHSCVRCKMLDKILKHMKLDEHVKTIYLEDVGEEFFTQKDIHSLPTLIIEKDGNKKIFSGNILPQNITDTLVEFGIDKNNL